MKILSNAAWKVISETLVWQREQLQKDREERNRLLEALGRKHDLPIVMPQADLATFPSEVIESTGWFDSKPVRPISTVGDKKQ